ncbi:efflux RND transporter periplasmic adaptor subunit [Novipirellula artificiosorum]|uniref:Macrolide export protein MacA n=1 Tax=Novipirellula artificiosorum TaxID=2528016 RepID=A0A5C6D2L3_9BACT|nr:efflux RND transporter periplasmic adaptor subunit [Novipirellula artificiosorum]TWU30978.1 Macrolide export protein MacA [Novipirellula artificiosorum]
MSEQAKKRRPSFPFKRMFVRSLKFVVVAAAIAAGVYWFKFSPMPVVEHPVERGLIIAEVMGTGTLEARVQATVSPKIAGRIERLMADQGDTVAAGDLLVELDDQELQQQVAIADANVEAARAALNRLGADKERANAAFTQAKKSDDRVQSLAGRGAASQEDSDKATEALAVAVTGVSRAEAAITEGQKELISAQKTLEYHRTRLSDARVLAPFDGLIVSRDREPGDVVVPGSDIMKLISTDQIWISAWVDETEMAKLHPEQPARILFRSEPNQDFAGKVVRLGKEADRETREFIVDVDALRLPENWAVGQRAEAFIEVARKENVVRIAANRVTQRDGQSGVFRNVADKAVWTPITIGLRNRDHVEVLSGLTVQDVLVSPKKAGAKLTDGRSLVAS